MSPPPTASQLLTVWEEFHSRTPVQRALALLALAADGTAPTADELGIGRRDRELLALREKLFGANLTATTTCPICGETVELNFTAAAMRAEFAGNPGELHTVVHDSYVINFRLPTCADLSAVPPDLALMAQKVRLLNQCVVEIQRSGAPVALNHLPASVVDAISARMAEIDPQGDVELALSCPACAHAWTAPLDISSYLWTELHAWALRLLRDVHDLALAYGWRETDIVALSPRRRQMYLDLLQP